MVSLVIGGARSGKSRFAQSLGATARRAFYIATARAEDAEMEARIAEHRSECDFLLLDCLTVWLSNHCWQHRDRPEEEIEAAALAEVEHLAAAATEAHVVIVTNEVGCGIVPETPIGRFFRDLQGRINQEAARLADQVILVVAGIPITIKQPQARP